MKKADYLIVGGGVAGTTAAEFARMNDSAGSISIITEEPERLYSRVLLPHYLQGKVPFERLFIRKLEQYEERNIELLPGLMVNKIDTQNKKASLSDGNSTKYKKLLIASGGKANQLQVTGSNLEGVTYLRTIEDVKKISRRLVEAKSGVVVGGGFIGIDFAEGFIRAGLKTTCVVLEPYFWSSIVGENSGRLITKILEKNGVEVLTNTRVSKFVGDQVLKSVKLSSGEEVPAEIAGVGIGIKMNLEYLGGSEIKTNKGVVTNEYLETETKDVWAAGDVAEFKDVMFDRHHLMGNWSNAAAQGKTAGQNMAKGWAVEGRERFETVSAYTTSVFDGSVIFLGDTATTKDTELIERGSVEEGKLGRIHIREDRVVGASLINLASDRNPISELIKNRLKLKISRDKLLDVSYDLRNLLK